MTIPPPKPVNAPTKPALNDPSQTSKENASMLNFQPSFFNLFSQDWYIHKTAISSVFLLGYKI
jgi:hypothetical protein